MSYGTTIETCSLAGVPTGRILKDEKPANLLIQPSTRIELIVNLRAAKALGLGRHRMNAHFHSRVRGTSGCEFRESWRQAPMWQWGNR
jgi:hypothetical protein